LKNNVQLHLFRLNFDYIHTFAIGYDYVRPTITMYMPLRLDVNMRKAAKRPTVCPSLEGEMPKTVSFGRNVQAEGKTARERNVQLFFSTNISLYLRNSAN